MAAADQGQTSDDEQPRKKRRVVDDSDDEKPAKSKAPSPKPAAKKETNVAPMFAMAKKAAANGNGKAPVKKADSEQGDDDMNGDKAAASEQETDAEEEEMEEEEESQAAAQIAEIFQKKQIGASKGSSAGPVWKEGESVPYAALVHCFVQIEGTTKRLEILSFLTEFLVSVIQRTPKDLLKTTYLCINRIAPDYEGIELGIGEGLLTKAIAEACGSTPAQIKAKLKETGDLGLVAKNSRQAQKTLAFIKPKPLTVDLVFNSLRKIAESKGNKSQTAKIGIIKRLLADAQADTSEAKFLIRSLEGKLRIGLAEKSVLVALAHAFVQVENAKSGKRKSTQAISKELEAAADSVKAVFSELPTYDKLIPALLSKGIEDFKEDCQLTPGVPLKPMLAKPTKAIEDVLNRFENRHFTCEYKYDGERAQVHILGGGKIRVFSRNSEDMSAKYPDLVVAVPKALRDSTETAILDCEAVAWDMEQKKILPFQKLSTRKRKDVKVEDIKVKVKLYGFDLIYLNGENLLHNTLAERRKLLREHFVETEHEFGFAISRDAYTSEEIQEFLDQSIKDSCEGLMVKLLDGDGSTYEPSKRSSNWQKVKKDYLQGAGDTFDLVVVGAFYGSGKRTGMYGAFLLACYDNDSERFQAVCKLGTGFSDQFLDDSFKHFKPLEIQSKEKRGDYDVPTSGNSKPDVLFEPETVWEVECADLSLSPIYPAAAGKVGDGARGISLRFPRYKRTRDDKKPEDATDSDQIAEAYENQVVAGGQGAPGRRNKIVDIETTMYDA